MPYLPLADLTFDARFGSPLTYSWAENSGGTQSSGPYHLGLVAFNGSDQFVDLSTATGGSSVGVVLPSLPAPSPPGADASLTGFSLEMVVQLLAPFHPASALLELSTLSGDDSLTLGLDAANATTVVLSLQSAGASTSVTVLPAVSNGTWYHLVLTVQPANGGASTRIQAYVDGVAVSAAVEAATGDVPYPAAVSRSVEYLGRSADGAYLDGSLDTLRVYAYALPASVVAQLYSFYLDPFQPYPPPQQPSAVFVDYAGGWTVGEGLAQLSPAAPPTTPVTAYSDPRTQNTTLPGAFSFSVRGIDLSQQTTGLVGSVVVAFIPPPGLTVQAVNASAACQLLNSTLTLTSLAGSAPVQCDYLLAWTAPFDGQLALQYSVNVTQPAGYGVAPESLFDALVVLVPFFDPYRAFPVPSPAALFQDLLSEWFAPLYFSNLTSASSPSHPLLQYLNPTLYSTAFSGFEVYPFAVAPLTAGIPVGAGSGIKSITFSLPSGTQLRSVNYTDGTSHVCALLPVTSGGQVALEVDFGSAATPCYLELMWTAPFTGQLLVTQVDDLFVPSGALGTAYEGTAMVAVNFTAAASFPLTLAHGTVFQDLLSGWAVTAEFGQLRILPFGPTFRYTDPTNYSTATAPSSFPFAVLPLLAGLPAQSTSGQSGGLQIAVPAGTNLTAVNATGGSDNVICRAVQDAANDFFIAFRPNTGGVCGTEPPTNSICALSVPVCYLELTWTAPFTGQLLFRQFNAYNIPALANVDLPYTDDVYVAVHFAAPAAAVVTAPSSSSTGAASAYSDPRFHGFWHQDFYVAGREGAVYSLLSDADVQLNAYFVQLQRIRCPLTDEGRVVDRCFDHPGTFFGVLAMITSAGDHLRITAGDVSTGFHNVTLNGRPLLPAFSRLSQSAFTSPSLSLRFLSGRSLWVQAGLYSLQVDNVDLYVDVARVEVVSWDELVARVRPEGLIGRTWNASAGAPADDEEVEAYRERDDNILGHNMGRSRFGVGSSSGGTALQQSA